MHQQVGLQQDAAAAAAAAVAAQISVHETKERCTGVPRRHAKHSTQQLCLFLDAVKHNATAWQRKHRNSRSDKSQREGKRSHRYEQ
jgi:hypothetical protein